MSRALAGLGAGVGVVAGGFAGAYAGQLLRMRQKNADMATIAGVVAGSAAGAMLGASVEKSPGTIGEPPQLNRSNFITDFAIEGPTDESLRTADCRWAKKRIPTRPECVDCEGVIPMWALQERVSFGDTGVAGFALGAAGDPEIWSKQSGTQQDWIVKTLVKLNDLIVTATGTRCATWAPAIDRASGCFQAWFNNNNPGLTKPDGSKLTLRTDGVFDQDTLDALRTIAAMNPKDFPTAYPGTTLPGPEKKLSTGAMVGIAAGGAAVLGGVVYFATRKPRRRR